MVGRNPQNTPFIGFIFTQVRVGSPRCLLWGGEFPLSDGIPGQLDNVMLWIMEDFWNFWHTLGHSCPLNQPIMAHQQRWAPWGHCECPGASQAGDLSQLSVLIEDRETAPSSQDLPLTLFNTQVQPELGCAHPLLLGGYFNSPLNIWTINQLDLPHPLRPVAVPVQLRIPEVSSTFLVSAVPAQAPARCFQLSLSPLGEAAALLPLAHDLLRAIYAWANISFCYPIYLRCPLQLHYVALIYDSRCFIFFGVLLYLFMLPWRADFQMYQSQKLHRGSLPLPACRQIISFFWISHCFFREE